MVWGAAALSQYSSQVAGQAFVPSFDDMMTMLIQPRHLKLFYAGNEKNWELAAAELRNLRSALQRTAQVSPTYLGNDVALLVRTMIEPQMHQIDSAIASADPVKFAAAYRALTDSCNACHTYTEHPFFVVKVPTQPSEAAEPNQEFKPAPQ